MYNAKYNLDQYIQFNSEVIKISLQNTSSNPTEGDKWIVTIRNNVTNDVKSETFNGVMVCSGHHSEPIFPKINGLNSFTSTVVHSKDFDTIVDKVSGKSVLVIGAGNSAGDTAVDCSNHGAKNVTILMRSGAWVIPRIGPSGEPMDEFAFTRFRHALLNALPKKWLTEWFSQIFLSFNHDYYGLKPNFRMMDHQPMVNDHLGSKIISGLISIIRGNVYEVRSDNTVVFELSDRKEKEDKMIEKKFDVIILATGYKITHPFLDWDTNDVVTINDGTNGKSVKTINGMEDELKNGESEHFMERNVAGDAKIEEWRKLYLKVFSPKLPSSLSFIGLIQPLGAFIPTAELQTRWYCAVMAGM